MSRVLEAAPPPIDVDFEFDEPDGDEPVYFCEGCPFRGGASSRLAEIAYRKYWHGTGVEAAGIFIDDDRNVSEVFNVPPDDTERSLDHKNIYRKFDTQQCFDAVQECITPQATKKGLLRKEVAVCPAVSSFVRKNLQEELKQGVRGNKWSK